jgi:hypothetical protein
MLTNKVMNGVSVRVGLTYGFRYNGKDRAVKAEKVTNDYVQGYDYASEGYRTFRFDTIESAVYPTTQAMGMLS